MSETGNLLEASGRVGQPNAGPSRTPGFEVLDWQLGAHLIGRRPRVQRDFSELFRRHDHTPIRPLIADTAERPKAFRGGRCLRHRLNFLTRHASQVAVQEPSVPIWEPLIFQGLSTDNRPLASLLVPVRELGESFEVTKLAEMCAGLGGLCR